MFMKVEKTLNFWVEDMNRKRVPLFITFIITLFNVGNGPTVRNLSIKLYRILIMVWGLIIVRSKGWKSLDIWEQL